MFFSLVMAIWAIVFLEFWKRYQSELCARWDVSEHELTQQEESSRLRPTYQVSVTETRLNPITQQEEPYLPKRVKVKRLVTSVVTVICFILSVVALLAGIMVYKVAGPVIWHTVFESEETGELSFSPTLMTSLTASIANGLSIAVMGVIYSKVCSLSVVFHSLEHCSLVIYSVCIFRRSAQFDSMEKSSHVPKQLLKGF